MKILRNDIQYPSLKKWKWDEERERERASNFITEKSFIFRSSVFNVSYRYTQPERIFISNGGENMALENYAIFAFHSKIMYFKMDFAFIEPNDIDAHGPICMHQNACMHWSISNLRIDSFINSYTKFESIVTQCLTVWKSLNTQNGKIHCAWFAL